MRERVPSIDREPSKALVAGAPTGEPDRGISPELAAASRRRPGPSKGWSLLLAGTVVAVAATLRLWHLGHGTLSPDETYSAVAAHLPFTEIPRWISTTDPHPPLFYLLLHPFASTGASDAQLRSLSATFSLLAVVAMAWWQRRRGWEGLLATALLAIIPFQLSYGRQARMYGLLGLVGVVAAAACWRWLGQADRRWAGLAALAALVAALSHVTGLILLPGLLLLPGARRDRAAWEWRAAIVAAGAVFVVVWGAALSRGPRGTTYHQLTSLQTVTVTFNEMVAAVPSNRWLVIPLLVAATSVTILADRRTGRVVVCAGLVPAAAALLIGLWQPIVMPKTFVVVGWMVPVVLAGLVAAVWRRLPLGGVVVSALLLVQIVPWIRPTLDLTAYTDGVVDAVVDGAVPGDAILSHPNGTLMRWYLADERPGSEHPIDLHLDESSSAFVLGDGPWNGRVWVVDATYIEPPLDVTGRACSVSSQYGDFHVSCIELDPASAQVSTESVP